MIPLTGTEVFEFAVIWVGIFIALIHSVCQEARIDRLQKRLGYLEDKK